MKLQFIFVDMPRESQYSSSALTIATTHTEKDFNSDPLLGI